MTEGGPVARQLPLYDRIAFLSADDHVLGWLSYSGPRRWTEQIPAEPVPLFVWMRRERPAVPLALYPETSLWARAASVIQRARQLREDAQRLQRSIKQARLDIATNAATTKSLLRPWVRPVPREPFTSPRLHHAHDHAARASGARWRSRAKAER